MKKKWQKGKSEANTVANPVPFFFHFVTIHMILKILSLFGMELQQKKKTEEEEKKERKKARKEGMKKGGIL